MQSSTMPRTNAGSGLCLGLRKSALVQGQCICLNRPFHGRRQPRYPTQLPSAVAQSTEDRPALLVTSGRKVQQLGHDFWNKTYYPTNEDTNSRYKPWYIIDAEGQRLGRLATVCATHIRGKHLPYYTPSMDMGGIVIVINAEKVAVTGKKSTDKLYKRHVNGRPGSMKVETFEQLQKRVPERIIEKAVAGMLPKGRLGRQIFHHLKVFKGSAHPHTAQQAEDITHKISRNAKTFADVPQKAFAELP